jgi:hypothetical protein
MVSSGKGPEGFNYLAVPDGADKSKLVRTRETIKRLRRAFHDGSMPPDQVDASDLQPSPQAAPRPLGFEHLFDAQ